MKGVKEFQIGVHEKIRYWNKDINQDLFNGFFKELKGRVQDRALRDSRYLNDFSGEIIKLDKGDFIIFKIGENINLIDIPLDDNKKYIFPFDKVFIEYLFYKDIEDGCATCDGILFQKFIKEKNNIIFATTKWTIFDFNEPLPTTKVMHLTFKEDDIINMTDKPIIKKEQQFEEKYDNFSNSVSKLIIDFIKRIMLAIEKKEYTSYKKWTYKGYIHKEIVYAYDVRSHKRHFWEDSGRFKIPLMSQEELKQNEYLIDELVFRDGELRKNVPYKIIGQFKVNEDSPQQEDNRKIELCMNKIFRKENLLGTLLHKIYPDYYIKRHDRKKLNGLELDYYIPELQIAFEYDGEQHFDKDLCANVFKSDFEELQKRDRKKNIKCRDLNIKLIRIKYDELLTEGHIRKRIKEFPN